MDYKIILLNILKGETDKGKKYYRLGYVFNDKEMIASNENFKGVTEHSIYVNADVFKCLDENSIFKQFELHGEMTQDYKNPLNQIFKPISLIDIKANYAIDLLEQKPQ